MPSPVGHSLIGYIIYRATPQPIGGCRWSPLLLSLFIVNAPDLDFIPGFLTGEPNRYHHGISHSLGFAALFSISLSLSLFFLRKYPVKQNFTMFFWLYSSHIILDYLSTDTSLPYGVPLFWPLSGKYYIAPFAFIPDVQRLPSSTEFLPSLFSVHNLWTVSIELILLVPLLLLVVALREKSKILNNKHLFL